MACTQTLNGIPSFCNSNQGGIIEVYIANFADVEPVTVDEESDMIKTISMKNSAKFKVYRFKKGTGSMTSTLTVDPTNGINFVQTDLSLQFAKQDTAKRVEMAALSVGELAVIVKDCNLKYWYLGKDEFVSATAGGANTGAARTDGNNYTLTLTEYSPSYPIEVDPTALSTIIDTAAPGV